MPSPTTREAAIADLSTLVEATVRDGDDAWHVECRFSDGQKFAAVEVAKEAPGAESMAHNIAAMLLGGAEALSARLTPPAEVVRYRMGPAPEALLEEPASDGQWVRYEDHAAALAAARVPPAEIVLETTAEERQAELAVSFHPAMLRDRIMRDLDRALTALAASEAARREAGEVLRPFAQYAMAVGNMKSDDTLVAGISGAPGGNARLYVRDFRRAAALDQSKTGGA